MAGRRVQGAPCLSSAVCEVLGDPESELYTGSRHALGGLGLIGYFAVSFGITSALSAIAVGLWSEIGCGQYCLEALRANERFAFVSGACSLLIVLALYLLDFFCPPHLPKQYLVLWRGDRFVGRCFLVLAGGFFVAFCILVAGDFPVVPLIVTVFLSPLVVLIFRWFAKPQDAATAEIDEDEAEPAESGSGSQQEGEQDEDDGCGIGEEAQQLSWKSFRGSMRELQRITGDQKEQRDFYLAATLAFAATGIATLASFLIWAVGTDFKPHRHASKREQEILFILWAAPLIVAISNLMFAMLMWLRVALHRTYAGSDDSRSRLVVEMAKRAMGQENVQRRIQSMILAAKRSATMNDEPSRWSQQCRDELKVKIDEYVQQQCLCTQRLSSLIKFLNAAFLVILGALFITFRFTATDSYFAMLAQGFVGAMSVTFVVYTMMAFTRIWRKLKVWLDDLPLFNSMASLLAKDWARGFVVLTVLPFLPLLLVVSALNQRIRRARGIQLDRVRSLGDETPPSAQSAILTERVAAAVRNLREWNWLSIIFWCYLWSYALLVYKLTPAALNILLAWMSTAMAEMHFAVILFLTFLAGFVLFMLPPVPGPPIYLFGGFVISDKCPWGFAWGTIICISLCFFLKLTACAVQQKLIGGYLSRKLWVKQCCGVHTPLMRAIERVLRRPGLSFGKVMILCGGPDWPTSVLAGILGISLFQCELGTTPVIASVVPLCLSGSFYLRRAGHGEIWARAGNFMFILTGVVSMAFWAGMAWAIQDEFDRNYKVITAAREEFVELEWLDFRASEISKRCKVSWQQVPRCVLLYYVAGVVGIAAIGHLFFWRSTVCFGMFELDDDIRALQWYGNDGLIRPLGATGFGIAAASSCGLLFYQLWLARFTRAPASEAARELDGQASAWQASRRREALLAAMDGDGTASPSPSLTLDRLSTSLKADMSDLLEVQPTSPQPQDPGAPTHSGHGFMGAFGDLESPRECALLHVDTPKPADKDDAGRCSPTQSPMSQASDAVSTPNYERGQIFAAQSLDGSLHLPNGICDGDDDWRADGGSPDVDLSAGSALVPFACIYHSSGAKDSFPSTGVPDFRSLLGGERESVGTDGESMSHMDSARAASSIGAVARRPSGEDEPDLT